MRAKERLRKRNNKYWYFIKNTNISIDIFVGMIYNHKVPTLKGGQQNVNREIHQ